MEREAEIEMMTLIKDMHKRMTYLEKKLDTLVKQSSEKSSKARGAGGPSRYSEPRERRYGAKNVRSGPTDENKRRQEGRVFPRKNQTYNPTVKKRVTKST